MHVIGLCNTTASLVIESAFLIFTMRSVYIKLPLLLLLAHTIDMKPRWCSVGFSTTSNNNNNKTFDSYRYCGAVRPSQMWTEIKKKTSSFEWEAAVEWKFSEKWHKLTDDLHCSKFYSRHSRDDRSRLVGFLFSVRNRVWAAQILFLASSLHRFGKWQVHLFEVLRNVSAKSQSPKQDEAQK